MCLTSGEAIGIEHELISLRPISSIADNLRCGCDSLMHPSDKFWSQMPRYDENVLSRKKSQLRSLNCCRTCSISVLSLEKIIASSMHSTIPQSFLMNRQGLEQMNPVFDKRLVQHMAPQICSTAVTIQALLDLHDLVLGSWIGLDIPWQKFQVNRFG